MQKLHLVAKPPILKPGEAEGHALVGGGGDAYRHRDTSHNAPNSDRLAADVDETPASVGAWIADFERLALDGSH